MAISTLPSARKAVRNPIDIFVLRELLKAKLSFSAEVDRAKLLRRAYFDLTGLPPEPAAVTEYLSDHRPDAYERLIDRLLTSPRYGERWGRHWLDLVGYAVWYVHTEAFVMSWRYQTFMHSSQYLRTSNNTDKLGWCSGAFSPEIAYPSDGSKDKNCWLLGNF